MTEKQRMQRKKNVFSFERLKEKKVKTICLHEWNSQTILSLWSKVWNTRNAMFQEILLFQANDFSFRYILHILNMFKIDIDMISLMKTNENKYGNKMFEMN